MTRGEELLKSIIASEATAVENLKEFYIKFKDEQQMIEDYDLMVTRCNTVMEKLDSFSEVNVYNKLLAVYIQAVVLDQPVTKADLLR